MVCQAPQAMKELMMKHVGVVGSGANGPMGGEANGAYMVNLMKRCDAVAMFDADGSMMFAWSQDGMNGWYWHSDLEEGENMYSKQAYDYTQGDGSKVHIDSETANVKAFMQNITAPHATTSTGTCVMDLTTGVNNLFFNGVKFHLTQRDVAEDGITYVVMGGPAGRGLHCAISPNRDCMVVAASSTSALPAEKLMDLDSTRPNGSIDIDARSLAAIFRQEAPGALGV